MNRFNDVRDIPELIMVGNDNGILYEKQSYIKRNIIDTEVDGMQRTTNALKYRRKFKLNTKK